MKRKRYLFLLLGLVFILATFLLSCSRTDSIDSARNYLKQALDEIGDLRRAEWYGGRVEDLDFHLESIERNIEDALDEIYRMSPNY